MKCDRKTLRSQILAQKRPREIVALADFACNSLQQNGASGRTRTYNLLIRSQKLYPIELRMRSTAFCSALRGECK